MNGVQAILEQLTLLASRIDLAGQPKSSDLPGFSAAIVKSHIPQWKPKKRKSAAVRDTGTEPDELQPAAPKAKQNDVCRCSGLVVSLETCELISGILVNKYQTCGSQFSINRGV
jgi:hypothetical protein